ncbi:MAG: class II aldolase/adducin family protein [Candidatus Melainabacteria bacterium]|nr:class II aldolase/adducin family protein [Candidatus Melainabacteria bacterium]
MPRTLIVGGTFDTQGGKPSKIITSLSEATGYPCLNGGTLDQLTAVDFQAVDVLVWAPNVSNDEDKILPAIKARNPKLFLISSKRVVEKQYSVFDVISRLLKSRSNLGIKITQNQGTYQFELLDPLGNCLCATSSVGELGAAIKRRVEELCAMTRIGSTSIGSCCSCHPTVNDEFVQLVRQLGDEFSRYVNAVNPERFLGNASARPTDRITRCCHGFPAMRADLKDSPVYLVSRRNVDKTTMSAGDFVVVTACEDKVEYFGDVKPSVDAPIQIRLFNFYNKVRYIVHGHVYVSDAPSTHSKVPCGHVEEFAEIQALFPDPDSANFTVNLKGHGCLILASDLDFLRQQSFVARPFPES